MSDVKPTPIEQWNAATLMLNHYQTVLNNRFSWMSALQGFVFTAFALTVNAAANAKTESMSNWLWGGVIVICLVGAALPWMFFKAIAQYGVRLQEIRKYWAEQNHKGFPPLRPEPVISGLLRLESLPFFASIAWTIAIAFAVVALFLRTVPTLEN